MLEEMKTKIQSNGKTAEATERRKVNIDFISKLNRKDLKNNKKEKQILIGTTEQGEKIFIQYPGKESKSSNKKHRPWDFRPKVLKPTGDYHKDLSFVHIWASFFEKILPICESNDNQKQEIIRLLTIYFYRMTYLLEHNYNDEIKMKTRLVNYKNGSLEYSDFKQESFTDFYLFKPNRQVIKLLSEVIPEIAGLSIEAFLYYNDLLAWNEDCKYYYRNMLYKDGKWMNKTGRVNNLLTHIHILGCFLKDLKWSKLLGKLQRGVAPPTQTEIKQLSEGIIS